MAEAPQYVGISERAQTPLNAKSSTGQWRERGALGVNATSLVTINVLESGSSSNPLDPRALVCAQLWRVGEGGANPHFVSESLLMDTTGYPNYTFGPMHLPMLVRIDDFRFAIVGYAAPNYPIRKIIVAVATISGDEIIWGAPVDIYEDDGTGSPTKSSEPLLSSYLYREFAVELVAANTIAVVAPIDPGDDNAVIARLFTVAGDVPTAQGVWQVGLRVPYDGDVYNFWTDSAFDGTTMVIVDDSYTRTYAIGLTFNGGTISFIERAQVYDHGVSTSFRKLIAVSPGKFGCLVYEAQGNRLRAFSINADLTSTLVGTFDDPNGLFFSDYGPQASTKLRTPNGGILIHGDDSTYTLGACYEFRFNGEEPAVMLSGFSGPEPFANQGLFGLMGQRSFIEMLPGTNVAAFFESSNEFQSPFRLFSRVWSWTVEPALQAVTLMPSRVMFTPPRRG